MFVRLFPIVAMLILVCVPVRAQQPDSPEALAQIKEGEVARLDLDTIRKYGESTGRFEVVVGRGEASGSPPPAHIPRRLRYGVNCDEGTMALAAVALYDGAGNVAKTIVVPPGAADPIKPDKGSEAYKWVQRTCMF